VSAWRGRDSATPLLRAGERKQRWVGLWATTAAPECSDAAQPYTDPIEARLGVKLVHKETGPTAVTRRAISAKDKRNWRPLAKWLYEQANGLETVLREMSETRSAE
jgi:hypothetical protein